LDKLWAKIHELKPIALTSTGLSGAVKQRLFFGTAALTVLKGWEFNQTLDGMNFLLPWDFMGFSCPAKLTGAFYVGLLDGLLGVAGIMIDRSPVDHSRKFPTF